MISPVGSADSTKTLRSGVERGVLSILHIRSEKTPLAFSLAILYTESTFLPSDRFRTDIFFLRRSPDFRRMGVTQFCFFQYLSLSFSSKLKLKKSQISILFRKQCLNENGRHWRKIKKRFRSFGCFI